MQLNAYELVQHWTSISRGGSAKDHAALLKQIPPAKLPEVIHNQLEGPMLSGVIAAIGQEFLPESECLQM